MNLRWTDRRHRSLGGLSLLLAASGLVPLASALEVPAPKSSPGVTGSVAQYTIPAVQLTREDGRVVSLPEEMNDGRPVVMNFVFTSCNSVCPLLSTVFAEFDRRLGADRSKVHLMSISIDPEADTPARLREYAHRYKAGPEWHLYTGTVEASRAVQRAFDVYRGDKMNHTAVTLLRAGPGQPWRRLDGFLTPNDLLSEYLSMERTAGALAVR